MNIKNYWLIKYGTNESIDKFCVIKARSIDKAIDIFYKKYGSDCIVLNVGAYIIEVDKELQEEES